MERLYLSRRNVLTLLSKLDRLSQGDHTLCTLTKRDTVHTLYPQTMPQCMITAVENANVRLSSVEHLYLTRSDLTYLLHILMRFEQGEHGNEPLTKGEVMVFIVGDERYYTEREAGEVHPKDEP